MRYDPEGYLLRETSGLGERGLANVRGIRIALLRPVGTVSMLRVAQVNTEVEERNQSIQTTKL